MNKTNDVKLFGRLHSSNIKWATNKEGEPVKNDDGDTALTGRIDLEINEAGNHVTVEFFGFPKWPSGKVNNTYYEMLAIMNGEYVSVESSLAPKADADGIVNDHHGKEPQWMSFVGNIDVNYFVSKRTKELARSLKIRGSFINENKKKEYSAIWTTDTIITNIEHVDADPEKELPAYVKLDGYIADYKENLSEISYQVRSEDAMAKLPVSEATPTNPFYTMLRGEIVFSKRTVVSEDAFGDEVENEYENKTWEVTRYAKEAYDFYDEEILGQALFDVKVKELGERKQAELDKVTGGGDGDVPAELNF